MGTLTGSGFFMTSQNNEIKTFIDDSAAALDTIHVSAGRRGLEIELSPQDLVRLTSGVFAPIAG